MWFLYFAVWMIDTVNRLNERCLELHFDAKFGSAFISTRKSTKQWIIQSRRVSYQAWLCITKLSASYLRLCFATEGHSCVRFNYWWSYGFFIRRLSPCHQTQWIEWCEGMGAFFHRCGTVVPVRLHYLKNSQFKWPVQRYWNLFLHKVTTKHWHKCKYKC